MALRDYLPTWLKRRLVDGSVAARVHDAIEATFAELEADRAQMDADTVLSEASEMGLTRNGIDLIEERQPGQTVEQYRASLQAVKQSRMLDDDGIRFALDKYGLDYTLSEFGDASAFWDVGFADLDIVTVPPLELRITFSDPFPSGTPTPQAKADAQRRLANAVRDVKRVKARGVRVTAIVPASLL